MPSQFPKNKTLSQIGEFGLIRLLKKKLHCSGDVIRGIGDDTAVFKLNKNEYGLLTTDMLLEGVHFTRDMPAQSIGHKSLACSISDIAAMGGIPQYALVSLGVDERMKQSVVLDIYEGMERLAKKFGVSVVGGDTVRSERLLINVALFGRVSKSHVVYRSNAQEGDKIFVTGVLGRSFSSGHHLCFTPRIKESQFLVEHFSPTSMIDISDGLLSDLGHILKASVQGALLYEEQIPLRKGAMVKNAFHDGEDFELLLTLSPKDALRLQKQKSPFRFSCIGEIMRTWFGFQMMNRRGKLVRLEPKGFTHF